MGMCAMDWGGSCGRIVHIEDMYNAGASITVTATCNCELQTAMLQIHLGREPMWGLLIHTPLNQNKHFNVICAKFYYGKNCKSDWIKTHQ